MQSATYKKMLKLLSDPAEQKEYLKKLSAVSKKILDLKKRALQESASKSQAVAALQQEDQTAKECEQSPSAQAAPATDDVKEGNASGPHSEPLEPYSEYSEVDFD